MELKYYLRGLGLGIVITAVIMGIASSKSRAMTDEEIIERAKQLGMIEGRVLSDAVTDDAAPPEGGSAAGENAMPDADGSLEENASADGNNFSDANDLAGGESLLDEDASAGESSSLDTNNLTDGNSLSGENGALNENGLPGENNDSGESAGDTSAALPDDRETGQGNAPSGTDASETSDGAGDLAEQQEADQNQAVSNTPMTITVGRGDGSYTVSKRLEDVGAVSSASAFDTFLCENGYDKRIKAGNYTIPADAGEEQIARMITGQE